MDGIGRRDWAEFTFVPEAEGSEDEEVDGDEDVVVNGNGAEPMDVDLPGAGEVIGEQAAGPPKAEVKRDSAGPMVVDSPVDVKPNVTTPSQAQIGNNSAPSSANKPNPQMTQRPALDSSFIFGSGEPFFVPPGSVVTYEAVDPNLMADSDIIDVYPDIALTPLQKLFVTTTGLNTTIGPSPNDPRLHLPLTHPGYPHTTCVRLTPETQKQSVISSLEKIKELATDCQEYIHRLEEIRERLANVGRARKKVWQVIRERAVLAEGEDIGNGEADNETMRLRAEMEHAIGGTGVETRRRRGVATAVASAAVS